MARLGYVGLGIMGGPMARHLATAKHSMTVYNRTTAKADAWVGHHGGARVLTPREVAQSSDFVLMCVGGVCVALCWLVWVHVLLEGASRSKLLRYWGWGWGYGLW